MGRRRNELRNAAGLISKLRIIAAVQDLKISYYMQFLVPPHFVCSGDGTAVVCSRQQNSEVESRTQGSNKAKDTKTIRGQGQGQPFRGQNLSRPRTGMLEAKAKDRGHRRKRSPKKKVFKNIFQAIFNSLAYPKFLIKEGLNHKSHDMTS